MEAFHQPLAHVVRRKRCDLRSSTMFMIGWNGTAWSTWNTTASPSCSTSPTKLPRTAAVKPLLSKLRRPLPPAGHGARGRSARRRVGSRSHDAGRCAPLLGAARGDVHWATNTPPSVCSSRTCGPNRTPIPAIVRRRRRRGPRRWGRAPPRAVRASPVRCPSGTAANGRCWLGGRNPARWHPRRS